MSTTILKPEFRRPIIAVNVSPKLFNRLKNQEDKRYHRIKKLLRVNQTARSTLYFFCYQNVDFENSKISGVCFNENTKSWEIKDFPFPDVLYDRVRGKRKYQIELNSMRGKFDQMGIKKINSLHSFDKWDLYQVLEKNDLFRPHLPLTRLLESTDDLKIMLDKDEKIYLKARKGSRGMQVMSVTKAPKGKYEYRFYSKSVVVGRVNDLYGLFRVIHSFFKGKNVIVQQAIDLLKIDSCVIDMRGELQRNGRGELEITAVPVRIGKKDAPIATRGTSYPFEVFFKDFLHFSEDEIKALKSKVDSFLIEVYKYIEQSYGPFGEIGIDIGFDKRGHIWFIECNAKSAKVSLCNTSDRGTIEKAFLNPLEYAKFISSC
ncbi:MAG: hypothetical protein CVU88_03540 [Firmicutes bacterium HGW-Firmicutes-13]|nr:MAG: hypothetical protein CVU88_03540 [Firmicutes bacterium HGW-Firmicutes-13]